MASGIKWMIQMALGIFCRITKILQNIWHHSFLVNIMKFHIEYLFQKITVEVNVLLREKKS